MEQKSKEKNNINIIDPLKIEENNTKNANKIIEAENIKKIPILSSNHVIQLMNYLKEILQEFSDSITKQEIINLLGKDLNEEEKDYLKNNVENIPYEVLAKIPKKLSNIYKIIKKHIKQTTEVNKKFKLTNINIQKEKFHKEIEQTAEEKLQYLITMAEKVSIH